MGKWSEYYRMKILDRLPKDKSLIRASELFKKSGLSEPTVWKYLKQLVKEGLVRGVVKSHKEKYYRRTESAELELVFIKFVRLWRGQLRDLYSNLDEEERQTLLRMLEQTASRIGQAYGKYVRRKSEG